MHGGGLFDVDEDLFGVNFGQNFRSSDLFENLVRNMQEASFQAQ